MKKKMTIDTLARMTQDEFARMGESIDARFDAVDKRFDKVDKQFMKLDVTLKTILDVVLEIPSKKAFERLENKVTSMDIRVSKTRP